jgi:hypothetical protein
MLKRVGKVCEKVAFVVAIFFVSLRFASCEIDGTIKNTLFLWRKRELTN